MDNRFDDFLRFATLQRVSRDIDPVYPMLRVLQKDMDPQEALWHSIIYIAYYDIGSGVTAYKGWGHKRLLPATLHRLPTGVERRALRGGVVARHLASMLAYAYSYGGLEPFLTQNLGPDVYANWNTVGETVQRVWGNGRWAAYKTCEILWKVNGFPLEAPDMGNRFSSGPRHGLELFFGPVHGNSDDAIAGLDAFGRLLQHELWVSGLEVGIEELETLLCDFHGMVKGRYYPGHDIDAMQESIERSGNRELWPARRLALPQSWLGEQGGWYGVDKARNRAYAETGQVLSRV